LANDRSKLYEEAIEVKGHLIDSMILTKIFDKIMDLKGDFQVTEFKVGKRKNELSYAKLMICGNTKRHLEELLKAIYIEGAQPIKINKVEIKSAPKDMALPTDFYSTTNNPTEIYYNNRWIPVNDMMMDKCIVLDKNQVQLLAK
jgi:hypothetical protein